MYCSLSSALLLLQAPEGTRTQQASAQSPSAHLALPHQAISPQASALLASMFHRTSLLKQALNAWQASHSRQMEKQTQQKRKATAHRRSRTLRVAFAAWRAAHKVCFSAACTANIAQAHERSKTEGCYMLSGCVLIEAAATVNLLQSRQHVRCKFSLNAFSLVCCCLWCLCTTFGVRSSQLHVTSSLLVVAVAKP